MFFIFFFAYLNSHLKNYYVLFNLSRGGKKTYFHFGEKKISIFKMVKELEPVRMDVRDHSSLDRDKLFNNDFLTL